MPPLLESTGERIDSGGGLSDALNSANRGKTRHLRRLDDQFAQFAKNPENKGVLAALVSSEVAGTRYALPSDPTLTVVWDPSQNYLEEL